MLANIILDLHACFPPLPPLLLLALPLVTPRLLTSRSSIVRSPRSPAKPASGWRPRTKYEAGTEYGARRGLFKLHVVETLAGFFRSSSTSTSRYQKVSILPPVKLGLGAAGLSSSRENPTRYSVLRRAVGRESIYWSKMIKSCSRFQATRLGHFLTS